MVCGPADHPFEMDEEIVKVMKVRPHMRVFNDVAANQGALCRKHLRVGGHVFRYWRKSYDRRYTMGGTP